VIDLKQFYKNAEFVGKVADCVVFAGNVCTCQGYQQSCPQFLGVRAWPYKNQGLSAVFGSTSSNLQAVAPHAFALGPSRMPPPL
jgi:hypothetical protein